MFALGHKRTRRGINGKSALTPKADIIGKVCHVRVVPKAEVIASKNAAEFVAAPARGSKADIGWFFQQNALLLNASVLVLPERENIG
jgi:hypothetical protein